MHYALFATVRWLADLMETWTDHGMRSRTGGPNESRDTGTAWLFVTLDVLR